MSEDSNRIKCPNCAHRFPVEDAFFSQAEERIKQEYEKKAAFQATQVNQQKEALETERKKVEQIKQQQFDIIRKKLEEEKQLVRKKFEEEKVKINQQAQTQAKEKFEAQLKSLETENERRKAENKELREKEVSLLQKEKDLMEARERMELDMEKKMLEKRESLLLEARKKEEEKSELRFKEYEKQLEDQKKLIEEMKRKAEQGSMQMQGEVQELALEDMLRHQFPFDRVSDVAKGIKGADVIHEVVNPLQQDCGKIVYESKRTKSFNEGWIEKLKADQRAEQAEIAVIVTESMPKEMERFGQKDGVWICSFSEIKSLAFVLREMLLKTKAVQAIQENKGDKMEMLYHYLTGSEFRQQVEAIVEGFTTMKSELDREKRALQRIWKEREKQIEKVIGNTVDMYGAVKGIAGNAIGNINALELPDAEDE